MLTQNKNCHLCNMLSPGGRLNIKMSFQYRDPMLKIRRSHDHLIFNMGIPITGKDRLCIETGPCHPCGLHPGSGGDNSISTYLVLHHLFWIHFHGCWWLGDTQTCQLLKIAWCSTFRGDAQRCDICIAAPVFRAIWKAFIQKRCFFNVLYQTLEGTVV